MKLDDIFPRDRLLEVDIQVADDDWDTLRHQSRNFFEALQPKRQFEEVESPYTYVEASVTIDGLTFQRVGIRKKGFIGSQSTSRPSLKVKLNHIDKKGGIDGLTMLTFNNNQQDNSQMSQFMGYSLFNAAGSPAPRCALAKVTVNGKNLGVYAHVESVKKPLAKRSFGSSKGTLYEGTVVDFHENWEGSFEKKFGKDKPGREHIVKVINALKGAEGKVFFGGETPGRAWVPTSGKHDGDWFKPDFDDSAWTAGENGAGYEREEGYGPLISDGFDFDDQMYGKATSLYLRFPFALDSLDAIQSARNLLLRMKCDDGFIAYLNGHDVARHNAPQGARWDSVATGSGNDQASMQFAAYDLSGHRDTLRAGRNLLALHVMNISDRSTDLLAVAELQTNNHDYEETIWKLIDEEAFYTFWTVEGLLSFWDGYSGNRNNFFVYLNPETDKFHFLPWGADSMFEKYSPLGVDRRSPRSVRTVGLVAHKLYQIPGVRKKYAEKMKALMAAHWDEAKLLAETERIEAMVKPHLSWEQKRKVDYEKIRRFIRNRRTDVEREISGEDMPLWSAAPEPPPVLGGERGWGRRGRGNDGNERPKRNDDGEAPTVSFWDAAKTGDIGALKQHLADGFDVNAKDEGGGSALGLAALAGQAKAITFLIGKGADPSIAGGDNNTPLHGAAFLGQAEATELLIEGGAKVNAINNRGETPLDSCAAEWSDEIKGIVDFISAIVGIKTDIEQVKAGRPKVVALLKANGGKSGKELASAGPSGLWAAAKTGDLAKLKAGLANGTDANGHDSMGITPLSWAAMTGQAEAVQLLIKQGADVNGRNRDGNTPLHGAAFLGQAEIVELLIRHKADVNTRSNKGETPLDTVAAEWNDETQGILQFVAGILKLEVDAERVEAARPKIAASLRKNGALTSQELN
ncbi:MAG: ankyrin repeat domain-containing protein [Verrucomicrobia bacterium]|nr:ankyrin repeat domain-containing protein [Verrucomicrobiota bacterium]